MPKKSYLVTKEGGTANASIESMVQAANIIRDAMLASQNAFAKDWDSQEDDDAWKDL